MAKGDNGNGGAKGATLDAVVFGYAAQLPAELVEKYGVERFSQAKYGGEEIDERGQRWVTVRMPIGPTVGRSGDTVVAITLVRQSDGYAVARLEMPVKVAGQYVAETSDPEPKAFAIDQAQRKLAESVEG
jgi:fermentation-respiration switch protein FrsA (DUF1100 family)